MPNLRDMLDEKAIYAGAPKSSKPSPTATKVAETLQDPVGATKDKFQKLNEAKLNYDQLRHETLMEHIPTLSVIKHIAQTHGVMPNVGTPQLDQGQMNPPMAQNPDDPNQVDEEGNPLDPTQGPLANPGMLRPSQAGFQPGVAPGPQESVRPGKLGMAKPGGKPASNSPTPKGAKPAVKKPGAAGKPGEGKGKEINLKIKGSKVYAGGPGSGRHAVGDKVKNVFNKKTGTVVKEYQTGHVHKGEQWVHVKLDDGKTVHYPGANFEKLNVTQMAAATSSGDLGSRFLAGGSHRLENNLGMGILKSGGGDPNLTGKTVQAGGPGSGRRPGFGNSGRSNKEMRDVKLLGKDLKHGITQAGKLGESKLVAHLQKTHEALRNGTMGWPHVDKMDSHLDRLGNKADKHMEVGQYGNVSQREMNRHEKIGSKYQDLGEHLDNLRTNLQSFMERHGAGSYAAQAINADIGTTMHEKSTRSENTVAYNPMIRGNKSKAAKKGWSTRGKGHLGKKEKSAHYDTMVEAGGPGSGRHPGGGSGNKPRINQRGLAELKQRIAEHKEYLRNPNITREMRQDYTKRLSEHRDSLRQVKQGKAQVDREGNVWNVYK